MFERQDEGIQLRTIKGRADNETQVIRMMKDERKARRDFKIKQGTQEMTCACYLTVEIKCSIRNSTSGLTVDQQLTTRVIFMILTCQVPCFWHFFFPGQMSLMQLPPRDRMQSYHIMRHNLPLDSVFVDQAAGTALTTAVL